MILKKTISLFMLAVLMVGVLSGCVMKSGKNKEIDLSDFFGDSKGCAVFCKDNDMYIYGKDVVDDRVSPCSTFKIVLTLAGLKYGFLKDENTLIKWDGVERYFDYWNKDLTLKEAFNLSAVWYFEKIANEIGKENLSGFVNELSYGNGDTSANIPFWIDSTLKISPREQVKFISNLIEYKLSIDKNYVDILKTVMNKRSVNGGTLYGKTGTSSESKNGWFVGAYEKDSKYLYFAIRLFDGENVTGLQAEKIARNIIENKL